MLDIVPLSLFSTLASSLSLVHMPRRGGCGLYNSGKCKFQESPDEHNGFRKRILKKKKRGCWDAKLSYVGREKQQCGSLLLFFLVVGIGKAWRDRRLAHVAHVPFFFFSFTSYCFQLNAGLPFSFFFFLLWVAFSSSGLFLFTREKKKKKKTHTFFFFYIFIFSFEKGKVFFFFFDSVLRQVPQK